MEKFQKRIIDSVPPPISEPLNHNKLFLKNNIIDVKTLQNHFFHEGKLCKEDAIWIIKEATKLFTLEPNILEISSPVTICGDIHGQYYDLIKLFEIGGNPFETTYLFLGDYVDRGAFSMECLLLLYSYKINQPKSFFMLRGNHECRQLTQYFTFKVECLRKYDTVIYELAMNSFDSLPLSAIVNKQFLCVHGGISPDIQSLNDINSIQRFTEPPPTGAMCDLLWSDPIEPFTNNDEDPLFTFNDIRGCSYFFSYKAACQFLNKNHLLALIRAHEAQDQGYYMHLKNESTGFPSVITIFSAPNYLDAYNNKGAILRYENNIINIKQFNSSPHPYWLPNFMDAFSWSLPFIAEKIGEILLHLLNFYDDQEQESGEIKNQQEIKAKVKRVSKILKVYSSLTKERETLMAIKSFTPENKIPQELLLSGVNSIKDALGNFDKVKIIDKINEKRPFHLNSTHTT